MKTDAVIDPTGTYRYSLTREWEERGPRACFVMLNPSTADASVDDPTIRRCIAFAKSWNCGSLEVVNLFAYRATNPKALKSAADPIGPENDDYIFKAARSATGVISAWGAHGSLHGRDQEVVRLIREHHPCMQCLGTTKGGHPRHPLYLSGNQGLEYFWP